MFKNIYQGFSITSSPSCKSKILISLVTLVAFITTTIWTPGVSFAMASLPTPEISLPYQAALDSTLKFFIPKDLGKIENLDLGQGPGIVHIQTAHGHYEAQQKIRKILHHLDKNYGIHTLLVEGSAFKLRPEILNFFPEDPKRTMKVADQLARHALVKGPELYLLDQMGATETVDRGLQSAEAYGIEDAQIYRENGEAFVRVLTQKQKTEQFLRDMDEGITRLSAPHLSDALRRFIRTQESFEKSLMSVDAWLSYLKDESQKNLLLDLNHPANQVEWPMMVRLFKIKELQKNLDLQQFEKEREKFLKAIKRFIPEEERAVENDVSSVTKGALSPGMTQESVRPTSFLAQIGRILQIDRMGQQLPDPETSLLFESMVRRLPSNFNYHLYPNVRYFIGILLLTSELKADRLMDESSRVAEQVTSRLARTDSEKAIVALLKDYRLLQKLFALELLPEDYETILASAESVGAPLKSSKKPLSPSSIVNRLESLAGQTPGAGRAGKVQFSHLDELDGLFDSAMQFYAGVKARDLAMIRMVEKRLKETGVGKVAVVTGGFHARPFRDYFASQGYTYALVTPQITGQDETGHRHYIKNTLQMTQAGAKLVSDNQATNRKAAHSALHAKMSTRETIPLMLAPRELSAMGADAATLARLAYDAVVVDNPKDALALAQKFKSRAEVRLTKQIADAVSRQVGSSRLTREDIRRAKTFDELSFDVQNALWEVFQNTNLIPDNILLDDWYVQNREDVIRSLDNVALNLGVHVLSESLAETEATPRVKTDAESVRELRKRIRERISKLQDEAFHLGIKRGRLETNYYGLSREELANKETIILEIGKSLETIQASLRELYRQSRKLREVQDTRRTVSWDEISDWKDVNLSDYEYLADETLVSLLHGFSGEKFQEWVESLDHLLGSGKSMNETERKIGIYVFLGGYLANGDDRDDLAEVALASRSELREDRRRNREEDKRLQERQEYLNNLLINVAVKFIASAILGVVIYFCYLSSAHRIAEKEAGMTPVEPAPVIVKQPDPRSELRAGKPASTQEQAEAVIRDAASLREFISRVNPIRLEELPENHPVRQWAINPATSTRAEVRANVDIQTLISRVVEIATNDRSGQPFSLDVRSLLWDAMTAIRAGDFPTAIRLLNKVDMSLAGLADAHTHRMIKQLRDELSHQATRSENRSGDVEGEKVGGEGRWREIFELAFYAGSFLMTMGVPAFLFTYAVGHWTERMEGLTAVPFLLTIAGSAVILMGLGAGIFHGLLFVGKIFFGFSLFETTPQDTDVSHRASSSPETNDSEVSVSKKRSETRSAPFLMETAVPDETQPIFLKDEPWHLKRVINHSMLTLIREFYYGIIPERVREGIETGLNTAGQALRAVMEAVGVSPADATELSVADRKKMHQRVQGILGIPQASVKATDVFVLGTGLLERLQENDGRGLVAFREAFRGSLIAAVADPETLAKINQILEEKGLEAYLPTQELKNRLPQGAVVRAVLLAGETLSEGDSLLRQIAERNIIRMTQGMLDRFMLTMEQIVTAMMGEQRIGQSA